MYFISNFVCSDNQPKLPPLQCLADFAPDKYHFFALRQGRVVLRTFVPDLAFGTYICHVDRHGQFSLKQLRLSLVNENYAYKLLYSPRLNGIFLSSEVKLCGFNRTTSYFHLIRILSIFLHLLKKVLTIESLKKPCIPTAKE